MKDIFGEIYNAELAVTAYDDKKDSLLKKRDEEMKEAYDNVQRKYYGPLYENQKDLEAMEQGVKERRARLSRLSTFDRGDIIEAFASILSSIYGEKFVFRYLEAINRSDGAFWAHRYDVHYVTSQAIEKTFSRCNIGKTILTEYKLENEDDIIVIDNTDDGFITDDHITFYDECTRKKVDCKKYDFLYDFIDQLINYRYNNEGKVLFNKEIMAESAKFIDSYRIKQQESKGKVKKK